MGALSCQPQPKTIHGAEGIGDPYYPQLGNGGYDVQKYTIMLEVDPEPNTVNGKTIIEAKTTESLESLNLDFHGLTVDSVSVNGATATFSRQEPEMTITPARPLSPGGTFTVEVNYHGTPTPVKSQAVSGEVGWFHNEDGTINVIGEPDGASTWFPNNNHPRDKALYHFDIKVPNPWIVAATGRLNKTILEGDHTRYLIELNDPAASYLVAINIGKYSLEEANGPHEIHIRNYFPPDYPDSRKDNFAKMPEMIEYLSTLYGPYPFSEYGVVIASPETDACAWAGALETQTLSIHCPIFEMSTEEVIVHEVAHQWFGDSVSLENWKDIWLKEGMATYAQWLWVTREKDLETLNNLVKSRMSGYFPHTPTGEPPIGALYRDEVYTGGALVFHALRLKVGEEAFFKIIRTYLDRYRGSYAGTDEFIAIAEEISGQNLQESFDSWLLDNKLPELP
jgi:aminopeptidase N